MANKDHYSLEIIMGEKTRSDGDSYSPCFTETFMDSHEGHVPGKAVMGPAHAASGAGILSLAIGLGALFGGPVVAVITAIQIVLSAPGSAVYPDLDNTRSTAKSSMGVVGSVLSSVFRFTSLIVQNLVRTKKDSADPNPHRGFWHTIVGSCVMGLVCWSLTLIPEKVVGDMTIGYLIGSVISGTLLYLGMNAVAKKNLKKMKSIPVVGDIILWVGSIAVMLGLQAMSGADYRWLGFTVALGGIVHILGDSITRAGVPIFFPITGFTKGKFWWDTRFAHFEAKDEGLNGFISIASCVAVVIGIICYSMATAGMGL